MGGIKNKINIWYILCLVETLVFSRVNLIFFIRGNKKNAVDFLFILFNNGGYHKRDLTYEK